MPLTETADCTKALRRQPLPRTDPNPPFL